MQILPTLGMGSSVVFYFASPNAHPFMRIMGVVMLVSTAAMVIAQIVRHRRGTQGQMADVRRDYLKYLAQTRRTVRRIGLKQRDAQLYLHPSPEQLWSVVAEGSRVWERRVGDADFGQARIGLGPQQLASPLVAPETAPVDELEPLCAGAMQRFLAVHGQLDGLPVAVSMRAFYHVTVSGEPERAQAAARALVAQLTTLHSPEDLLLAVVAAPAAVDRWDWTKWLPHSQLTGQFDGAGTRRLFGDDLGELEQLLSAHLEGRPRFSRDGQPVLDQPHIIVVLDGGIVPPTSAFAAAEGLQGVTIIEVVPGELDQPRGGLSIVVRPDRLWLDTVPLSPTRAPPTGCPCPPRRHSPGSWRPCAWAAGTTTNHCSPTWTSPICWASATPPPWRSLAPGDHGRRRSACGSPSASARTADP